MNVFGLLWIIFKLLSQLPHIDTQILGIAQVIPKLQLGVAVTRHAGSADGLSGPEKHQRVLERMGVSESLTLAVRREEGGKIRVTSNLWDNAKAIGKDEVLEVRNVDGRLHIARKERRPDQWDSPIEPYDPYGPGTSVTRHGGDEAIND